MVSRTSTDHTSALPTIYIPPWAGGVSLWGGPLGVRGANPPPVGPRRPHNPAPLVSMTISKKRTTNVSHGSRHFHQLFRQLRLENRTMRDGIQWDLGHCDDLLGNCSVEELEDVHQTICCTGASRSSTGRGTKDSIICSVVCRWIRSCGPRGSTRPVGRASSSSNSEKNAVSPATLVFDV